MTFPLFGFMTSSSPVVLMTAINSASIANDDISTLIDIAETDTSTITLDQKLIDEWSSPSSGDAKIGFVYSGDIDASTSSRVPVQLEAGEIYIQGARRVENELVTQGEVNPANGGWSKIASGSGTSSPTVTDAFAPGPSGQAGGAVRVQFDASGGTIGGDASTLREQITNQPEIPQVFSVWMKLNTGSSDDVVLQLIGGSKTVTVTDTWQRFSVAGTLHATWRIDIEQRGNVGSGNGDILIAIESGYQPQLEIDPTSNGLPSEIVSDGLSIGSTVRTTGKVTGTGVAYFPTKNGNTVDGNGVVIEAVGAAIPDIDGLVVRDAAEDKIVNADGTGWTASNVTITTGQTLGVLNAFTVTGDATNDLHRALEDGAGANNPHYVAFSGVLENTDGVGLVGIRLGNTNSSVNFDLTNFTVTAENNAVGQITQLSATQALCECYSTNTRAASTSRCAVHLIETTTSSIGNFFDATGRSVKVAGATMVDSASAITTFPGIINNNTGSTLTRLAESAPLAVSAADLATRGAELVTNGGFDTDSDWDLGGTWTISGGVANGNGLTGNLTSNDAIEDGKYYEVKFDAVGTGSIAVRIGLSTSNDELIANPNGSYTFRILSDGTTIRFRSTSYDGTIDNISVRELTPNHAIMVAYKQPSVWPGADKPVLVGDNGEAILQTTSTPGQLKTTVGDFEMVHAVGSTTAGAINKVCVTPDGSNGLQSSVNGSATASDSDADDFGPTYSNLEIGSALQIAQVAMITRRATGSEPQELTS